MPDAKRKIPIIVWIGLGSGLGGVLRQLLELYFGSSETETMWAILLANGLGSLAIGMIAAMPNPGPAIRAFLMPGLCGGFTTFSIFSLDTLILVQAGHSVLAAAYVLATLSAALGGVASGFYLIRFLRRQEQPED